MREPEHPRAGQPAKWAVRRVVIAAALVPVVWAIALTGGQLIETLPLLGNGGRGNWAVGNWTLLGMVATSALFWGWAAGWLVDLKPRGRLKVALGIGVLSPFLAPLIVFLLTSPLVVLGLGWPGLQEITGVAFVAAVAPLFVPLLTIPVGLAMGFLAWWLLRGHYRPAAKPVRVRG